MSYPILTNIDLNLNQILNAVLHQLAADPGSPVQGQYWFNSTSDEFKFFDGTDVHVLRGPLTAAEVLTLIKTVDGTGSGLDADLLDGQEGTHYLARANHTGTQAQSTITGLAAALAAKIDDSEKGAANGVAELDASGLVPVAQLPPEVFGGLAYQGTWNASTNSPTITDGSGDAGEFYRVATAGSTPIDGISEWAVGDWIISDGTAWQKIDNTDQVVSVAGRTGAVVLTVADVSGALAAADNLSDLANAGTARDNLGLGTAATHDVPASGNAAAGEVVLGNDTRLAAASALRFSDDVGNGSLTQIDVVHSLGTRDVVVQVRQAASPYAAVLCDAEMLDTNTVRLRFAVAPSSNQYRVTVLA